MLTWKAWMDIEVKHLLLALTKTKCSLRKMFPLLRALVVRHPSRSSYSHKVENAGPSLTVVVFQVCIHFTRPENMACVEKGTGDNRRSDRLVSANIYIYAHSVAAGTLCVSVSSTIVSTEKDLGYIKPCSFHDICTDSFHFFVACTV